MAVLHFVTQFTHVFRYFGVYCRKQRQKFRENCFESVVSNKFKKMAYVSLKLFLEKMQKKVQKKERKKNNENVYNIWRILGRKLVLLKVRILQIIFFEVTLHTI